MVRAALSLAYSLVLMLVRCKLVEGFSHFRARLGHVQHTLTHLSNKGVFRGQRGSVSLLKRYSTSSTHIGGFGGKNSTGGSAIIDEESVRNGIITGSDDKGKDGPFTTPYELEGLTFAITGKLSVSRAEFEKFITAHGGEVAKSVTNAVTHLVNAETGTKKCEEAEAKGVKIIDEDWVRNHIAMCSFSNDDKDDSISYTPRDEFVQELLALDEDEGILEYDEGKAHVGKVVWNSGKIDCWQDAPLYKVTAFKEVDDEGFYTLVPLKAPSKKLEIEDFRLTDAYCAIPPPHLRNYWERYQQRRIREGVWRERASEDLRAEVNHCVDLFAAQEPEDLHPGTNGVVRDLVHPSLYPLIIDPESVDVTKTNHWGRAYEKSRFQWLPAEVAIDGDGNAKFVSPINNLNTDKYPELQHALEKVFSVMVPGFEKVWEYAQKVQISQDESYWPESYPEIPPVSFKNTTLQAVVKIADYVFAPEASFSGVWHYEGMAHENIVMTGLFYPNSDERLGGGLEFKRQFTDVEANKVYYGVSQIHPPWLDAIIGEGFVPLGQTTTETGSLLVFPNCHAHRVLEMVNKTPETLRRRLVVFFVVDPSDRIPSSKEHPPMPRRVSHEVALSDRLELMQERKQAKQDLNPREIELCEH